MPQRRLSRASAFALALAVLAPPAIAAGEGEGTAPQAPVAAPAITVVRATAAPIAQRASVTGTLTPRETVSVGADVEGLRVEALLADEGDRVEAGQVLARLATDTIEVNLARSDSQIARAEAGIAQAQAQVAEAESAAVEAEAALKRTQALSGKGIVGQEILDQRVSGAAATRARLVSARQGIALAEADKAAAQAERRELELQLSKTEIKAPTAGLVLQRQARLGQIASAAGGALFEIARDGEIELDADVSETVLGALAKGQPVTVTPAGGQPVQGSVRLVSPRVDQATRLGRVRVALPASDRLRVGAFARGVVETASAQGVLVPRTAVVTNERGSTVQVVTNDVVETRAVTLGIADEARVEIREGVAENESVVARAGTFVRDGDRVRPIEADAATVTAEAAR